MTNTFADRIQVLIDKHGRGNLSKKVGISTTQLHRLRTGGDTSRLNLLAICDATGVNLEWLARGEGRMYPDDPDPQPHQLSKDQEELLALYDNATLVQKMQVIQLLSTGQIPSSGHSADNGSVVATGGSQVDNSTNSNNQTIHGNGNVMAGGRIKK